MSRPAPKIAFFGTPRLAQIVLESLIDSKFKPQVVITAPDEKAGRGQKLQPSPVKQTALKHNIETSYQLPVTSYQLDLAILVAYGKIIPAEILTLPRLGFVNVHPSLLPKYRGPSPIQSAILEDEQTTGVTIIKLDEVVDHGPILAQEQTPILESDTHLTLVEKLGLLGADLLLTVLANYLNGSLQPKKQNHTLATFTRKIEKIDGYVDLDNPPLKGKLDRMVRAFYPWPGVWIQLKTHNSKLITIKFLPGNLIQPEGKKPMTIRQFLNGYPNFGDQLAKLI